MISVCGAMGIRVAATLTTDDSGNKRGAIIKLHTGFNDFDGRIG